MFTASVVPGRYAYSSEPLGVVNLSSGAGTDPTSSTKFRKEIKKARVGETADASPCTLAFSGLFRI
ncbi:MAG TPA: hypothetical protein PKD26_09040 [Pyrinomonadaceae bacterium]|nr:hypothetical protein [Pyrinomonadaceae bacterium]